MIPFNKPYMIGTELGYIAEAHRSARLSGDGPFTHRCHQWIESQTGCHKALLAHSCTAALEMAAILADIQPGDEVILPSYTFVSTANAFVLRGAVPVFIDIRADTLNLDENLIEEAITPRTRAIVPVHYAGVACEMDTICAIASRHNLIVVEDAAQGVMAKYKGRALGSIGALGAYSFHETKNVISGEGGALLVNCTEYVQLAEIIREKGTNRSQFFRGEVDKYTWHNIGSSFLPSELTAAFLWAQLERAEWLTEQRMQIWRLYHEALRALEDEGLLRRPVIPMDCEHNAHMYYILVRDVDVRSKVLAHMKQNKINGIFHYVPLHSSPGGMRYGRTHGSLKNTDALSECLIRLPLWIGMTESNVAEVVHLVASALREFTECANQPRLAMGG